MKLRKGSVAEWELIKGTAIELYPMSLKKQQEYVRARMKTAAELS